jgi:hypothetical protein
MLDLENNVRTKLVAGGALTINDEGNEVFAGLDVPESEFFLKWEKEAGDGYGTADASIYMKLKHKHLLARSSALLGDYALATGRKKEPPES